VAFVLFGGSIGSHFIGCRLACGRLAGFGGFWFVQYDWLNIS
jgi:hypothetical protein